MYNEKITTKKGFVVFVFLLIVFLFLLILLSFNMGRFTRIDIVNIPKILLNQFFPIFEKTWTDVDESVVLNIRFPRITAAVIVGASLAISGFSYQALFANPIASSDSLGVASSAAFGAVLGFLMNLNIVFVKGLSFLIGCISVFSVYYLAAKMNKRKNLTVFLILIGMVVSSLFGALLSITKYVADPIDQLPKITYWLMGSISNVRLTDIPISVIIFFLGAVPLFMIRWRINLLVLSDVEAKALGENITLLRAVTIFCATLLTSSAVAMTGGISWVGLVIPHIARLLVGNDARKLLPTSALMGGLFLLAMDDMARSISVYELPISILTSLFGAPVFFIILIWRRKQIIDEN